VIPDSATMNGGDDPNRNPPSVRSATQTDPALYSVNNKLLYNVNCKHNDVMWALSRLLSRTERFGLQGRRRLPGTCLRGFSARANIARRTRISPWRRGPASVAAIAGVFWPKKFVAISAINKARFAAISDVMFDLRRHAYPTAKSTASLAMSVARFCLM
jgi:hypothetical protein